MAAKIKPKEVESRNFYRRANPAYRDWLLDQFELSNNPVLLRKNIKNNFNLNVSLGDIREAIVMSYIDSGESERALDLALQYRGQSPTANMHNLVLKSLLSSWRYSRKVFFDESKSWGNLYAHSKNKVVEPYHNSIPRIGFVCDYGSTVFGENAIFPMCEAFSESGFEVYYYNFERVDPVPGAVKFNCRNVFRLSVGDLIKLILQDKIDALVDLNGRLTERHRLGVFSSRAAPIQLNYFNLAGTSGVDGYDYVLADEVQIPEEDKPYYSETVLRLPCGVNGAYSFQRDVPIKMGGDSSERPFVFASFNAFFKYNTVLLQTWAEILRRVPNSILIIKCGEIARQRVVDRIAREFGSSGIDLNRIYIEGWSDLCSLRKKYEHVDLCLDTFPYSGGSSTLNSIWQGVPVLTWMGEGWRARSTASILHASQLTEFVVDSRSEYIEKAVYLAHHRRKLIDAKEFLLANVGNVKYFCPQEVYSDMADLVRGLICQ